jgi:hypothetical protein
MSRGVTVNEFASMCLAHMPQSAPRMPLRETTQAFLDRCCDLGLVRRQDDDRTTRYAPTPALALVVAMWGPDV